MGKNISIWVSDEQYESIKILSEGNMSGYLKHFLMQSISGHSEHVKSETAAFENLLQRIEEITNGSSKKTELSGDVEIVLKYLKRILGEAIKANIAIEELAKRRLNRRDIFEDYMQSVEERLLEKQQAKV